MYKKIIAHDLGTGGNKAALFDADGRLIASSFVPYPTSTPANGIYEQKPEDWFRAVAESTRALLAQTKTDPNEIVGIALSGHSLGTVPLGKDGNLLREQTPIWSDRRAEAEAETFFQKTDSIEWYKKTGNGFPPPHYTVFKALWYQKNEPDIFRKCSVIIGTKDYVNFRLTGKIATDPSYASGSGIYDLERWAYSPELLEASGLSPSLFPPIIPSTEPVGTLLPEVAKQLGLSPNTIVCAGGVDNSCMALGAGAFKPGRLYASLGSSSWIALSDLHPVIDLRAKSYIFTHVVPGMFTSALSIFSSGTTFRWIRDHFCRDLLAREKESGIDPYDLMTAEAALSPIGSNGILMNPSFAGGTLLDANPDMRGGFARLDLSHTRGDIIRSVMEGIAMNMRSVKEAIQKLAKTDQNLIAVGGGANSDLWCRIYADVLNMKITRVKIGQNAAALGAAAVALCGCGLWNSFEPIDDLLSPETAAEPAETNTKLYDKIYTDFKNLSKKLGEL